MFICFIFIMYKIDNLFGMNYRLCVQSPNVFTLAYLSHVQFSQIYITREVTLYVIVTDTLNM